jgi:hypothetical protein
MKHGQDQIRVREVPTSKRKNGASVEWLRHAETMRTMRTGLAGRRDGKADRGSSESCTVPTSSLRLLLSHVDLFHMSSISVVHMYPVVPCTSSRSWTSTIRPSNAISPCMPRLHTTQEHQVCKIPTCYGNIGPQVSTWRLASTKTCSLLSPNIIPIKYSLPSSQDRCKGEIVSAWDATYNGQTRL